MGFSRYRTVHGEIIIQINTIYYTSEFRPEVFFDFLVDLGNIFEVIRIMK